MFEILDAIGPNPDSGEHLSRSGLAGLTFNLFRRMNGLTATNIPILYPIYYKGVFWTAGPWHYLAAGQAREDMHYG